MTKPKNSITSAYLSRVSAQGKSSPREASDKCFICSQSIWFSVLFDEPSHDAEKERGASRLSNLGKVFYSHAVLSQEEGIYPVYYNGLGVKFREHGLTCCLNSRVELWGVE